MARISSVYYIAPSAISITPNANGSADDLAVYLARDAKIKVYYPDIEGLRTDDSTFREWTLAGKNRRLKESGRPYTIYARLLKTDTSNGYLVFAPQVKDENGEWQDPYVLSPNTSSMGPIATKDAKGKVIMWPALPAAQTEKDRHMYWWIKVGTVSAPNAGARTMELDTGILGTDQYNEDWSLDMDAFPLRVEIDCDIDGEGVGSYPYVCWGQEVHLSSTLMEGFEAIAAASRIDHWEITRIIEEGSTAEETSDGWPDDARKEAFRSSGEITLSHDREKGDDFAGAEAVMFTVVAWGEPDEDSSDSSGEDGLVQKAVATITIHAETYGVITSDDIPEDLDDFNSSNDSVVTSAAMESYIDRVQGNYLRKDLPDEKQNVEGDVEFEKNVEVGTDLNVGRNAHVEGDATIETDLTVIGESLQLGDVTFSSQYEEGTVGGKLSHPKKDTDTKLQVQYLHVTKKATFETLEINHVEHIAGNLVLSAAKATLYRAENRQSAGFRCYFLAQDSDGNTIYNTWKVHDQAYCCTFDLGQFTVSDVDGRLIATKAGNHYWWRLVTAVSDRPELVKDAGAEEGRYCHWFDLSPTDYNYASDAPMQGDYVVLRGHRTTLDTDTSLSEREGTIELLTVENGPSSALPSVRIYQGIQTYTLPPARINLSPSLVSMVVDELHIKTSGKDTPLADYVDDNLDKFVIFQTETTAEPTLTDEPAQSWTPAEKTKYSTPPNNAVVLNADGRTWKFIVGSKGYQWEEFTDPYLLARHNELQQILDDNIIAADELQSIKAMLGQYSSEYEQAFEEFENLDHSKIPEALKTAGDNLEKYCQPYVGMLYDLTQMAAPIQLPVTVGTGANKTEYKRDSLTTLAGQYRKYIYLWQSALSVYRTSDVDTAIGNAIPLAVDDYIEKNRQSILDGTIDARMKQLIQDYLGEGAPAEGKVWSEFKAVDGSVTLVNNLLNKQEDGSFNLLESGLVSTLNSTFVGASSLSWETDENGKSVITNISKAGLVTNEYFTSIFADMQDQDGNVTKASVSAFINKEAKLQYETIYGEIKDIKEGTSVIDISANKVFIRAQESDKSTPTFYLDGSGNVIMQDLWAKNITVEGVINNLENIIDTTNANEKIIPAGDYPVTHSQYYEFNGNYDNGSGGSLDILRLGDVINIQNTGGVINLFLPSIVAIHGTTYAESGSSYTQFSHRTYTRYGGGTTPHPITYTELRQLIGRRIHIYNNTRDTLYLHTGAIVKEWMDGFAAKTSDSTSQTVFFPMSVHVDYADNLYEVADNNDNGIPLTQGCAITLMLTLGSVRLYPAVTKSDRSFYATKQGIFWRVLARENAEAITSGTTIGGWT